MAKFINKKEQVFDLQLTTYGRKMLSVSSFKPTYYAFFDDNVVYDGDYIGLNDEKQNEIITLGAFCGGGGGCVSLTCLWYHQI